MLAGDDASGKFAAGAAVGVSEQEDVTQLGLALVAMYAFGADVGELVDGMAISG